MSKVVTFKIGKRQHGFTLIELVVSIAILGVLAAIAVPSLLSVLNKGGVSALQSDEDRMQAAVDSFRSDKHAGPNSSNVWGTTASARLYPTKDGTVGSVPLELATATDSTFADRSNFRVHQFAAGAALGATATDAQIGNVAVWVGLLVNDPQNSAASEQSKPGGAHPQASESGHYLLEFPKSAGETNTDVDATSNNSTCAVSCGTYVWIVLQNGKVVPAYKSSDGSWYTGSNDTYP